MGRGACGVWSESSPIGLYNRSKREAKRESEKERDRLIKFVVWPTAAAFWLTHLLVIWFADAAAAFGPLAGGRARHPALVVLISADFVLSFSQPSRELEGKRWVFWLFDWHSKTELANNWALRAAVRSFGTVHEIVVPDKKEKRNLKKLLCLFSVFRFRKIFFNRKISILPIGNDKNVKRRHFVEMCWKMKFFMSLAY